jgi:hypothetical protein
LLFIVSGASFISKKIKEQGLLRKSHQKTYPFDPGSGKNSSRIQGQKSTGSRISNTDVSTNQKLLNTPGTSVPDPEVVSPQEPDMVPAFLLKKVTQNLKAFNNP